MTTTAGRAVITAAAMDRDGVPTAETGITLIGEDGAGRALGGVMIAMMGEIGGRVAARWEASSE
jgi:hypothetical protein